jgi:hypothetical protein
MGVVWDCVGAALVYVGDSWNVWEPYWFMWETSRMCGRFIKSAITTYVDEYIDFFRFYFYMSHGPQFLWENNSV